MIYRSSEALKSFVPALFQGLFQVLFRSENGDEQGGRSIRNKWNKNNLYKYIYNNYNYIYNYVYTRIELFDPLFPVLFQGFVPKTPKKETPATQKWGYWA